MLVHSSVPNLHYVRTYYMQYAKQTGVNLEENNVDALYSNHRREQFKWKKYEYDFRVYSQNFLAPNEAYFEP